MSDTVVRWFTKSSGYPRTALTLTPEVRAEFDRWAAINDAIEVEESPR